MSVIARRMDIGTGQIYRWRRELCSAVAGFAEVVVSPPACEKRRPMRRPLRPRRRGPSGPRSGDDANAELACAVIKAVVAR